MSQLTINTTQNVSINFRAASIGERMGAHLLDLLVKAAYCIVVYVIIYAFLLKKYLKNVDDWTASAIIMLLFLPVIFYSLVLESMLEGQTLGKRALKIKVVKLDGYQASFGDYLIRWLFCIIDITLFSGIIGIVTMATSKKVQRLGDMSAGTAVITLRKNISIEHTILENIGDNYVPVYPLVIKLSDNDVRIIKETFTQSLRKNDLEMIGKLRNKVETVTGITNQSGNSSDFLRTVLKDYNFYTQNM